MHALRSYSLASFFIFRNDVGAAHILQLAGKPPARGQM